MSLVAAHHTSKLDRTYVESVFDSYSVTPKKEPIDSNSMVDTSSENSDQVIEQVLTPDDQHVITKGNAILAYEEVFQMWKVDLNLEQQKKVKDIYFSQAWDKFAENGNLDEKDSYRFLKDMMTEPIIKRDPTVAASQA